MPFSLALLDRAPEPEGDPLMCEWISAGEAALRLRIHISTLYKYLHNGQLPCRHMQIGRTWRIAAEDVEPLGHEMRALVGNAESDSMASALAIVTAERS